MINIIMTNTWYLTNNLPNDFHGKFAWWFDSMFRLRLKYQLLANDCLFAYTAKYNILT